MKLLNFHVSIDKKLYDGHLAEINDIKIIVNKKYKDMVNILRYLCTIKIILFHMKIW